MNDKSVQILWDHSRLWGILAWRAMSAMGVPCSFVSAQDIAQGSLLCKPPAILLVPGGSAGLKARALGCAGREQIRQWVHGGGSYIGFCGGAGLALTQKNSEEGLGLCPWQRKSYGRRLYHLISGSVLARTEFGEIPLPVWWPGRFEEGPGVDILARYVGPGPDLLLADLPLMEVPRAVARHWQEAQYLDISLDFPPDQPLVIGGAFGKGQYVLSYAHLETPGYASANEMLAVVLAKLGCLPAVRNVVPPWQPGREKVKTRGDYGAWLEFARTRLGKLTRTGLGLGLFFPRTSWLVGWRHGAPGMAINHLEACLDFLARCGISPAGEIFWTQVERGLKNTHINFVEAAEEFLWNWRLAATLGTGRKKLEGARNHIFGHPMAGGGQLEEILGVLDVLVCLNQMEEI